MAAKFKRKETKMETPSKLNINTGREGQQSLSADPISRAVLLTLGLPVIRVQKEFWILMTDKRSVRTDAAHEALKPTVLSLMALHADASQINTA